MCTLLPYRIPPFFKGNREFIAFHCSISCVVLCSNCSPLASPILQVWVKSALALSSGLLLDIPYADAWKLLRGWVGILYIMFTVCLESFLLIMHCFILNRYLSTYF